MGPNTLLENQMMLFKKNVLVYLILMQLRNQPLVIVLSGFLISLSSCDVQYVVSATPTGVSELLYLSFYRNRELNASGTNSNPGLG